jgi:hypothetical protein
MFQNLLAFVSVSVSGLNAITEVTVNAALEDFDAVLVLVTISLENLVISLEVRAIKVSALAPL